jgi:hypothetical protein
MTSDGLKRVLRTFLIAFFGIFIPGAFQFLNEVTSWANSQGQKPFPDMHSASFVLVAALAAGMIALLNLIVNWVEDTVGKGFLRTVPPKSDPGYVEPQGGYANLVTLLVAVVVIIVLLIVIF